MEEEIYRGSTRRQSTPSKNTWSMQSSFHYPIKKEHDDEDEEKDGQLTAAREMPDHVVDDEGGRGGGGMGTGELLPRRIKFAPRFED